MHTKGGRTLDMALKSARQLKDDLPRLSKPSSADYDRVLLAEHINRLARKISHLRRKKETLQHAAD